MNLLEMKWLPVRRADGTQDWIAPHQITERDNPPVTLAAVRPDFNGALIQFLIGLVQTAWIKSGDDWSPGEMLLEPPTPEVLQSRFAPLRDAFALEGDGPRFMQDLSLSAADKPAENEIAALLIEAPGEQALERNTDHFIKRGRIGALCPRCAAMALFTLQTNAPSGGAGHRTSLRGGGPLTTLVLPELLSPDVPDLPLWRLVAANVLPEELFHLHGDAEREELFYTFPWLKPQTATQKDGGETQPDAVHPLQRYWAMPRRVRLDLSKPTQGRCDLCAEASESLVTHYLTKNYGLNYKGPWRHPLSPYYRAKDADPYLAMHPQPGGFAYRHWLGWVLGSRQPGKQVAPAQVVQAALARSTGTEALRLWVFGYDLDNMKARCWYESTFPLFSMPIDESAQAAFSAQAEQLLAAATTACDALRYAVRTAWGNDGDLAFVDASFWSRTEQAFFETVRAAATLAAAHGRDLVIHSEALRRGWATTLMQAAQQLFHQHAASGEVEASNPQRLGAAWRQLCNALGQSRDSLGKKLQQVLGLAPPDADEKPAKGRRSKSKSAATGAPAGEVA